MLRNMILKDMKKVNMQIVISLQIIRTCLMQMGNLYMIQIGKMRHIEPLFPIITK